MQTGISTSSDKIKIVRRPTHHKPYEASRELDIPDVDRFVIFFFFFFLCCCLISSSFFSSTISSIKSFFLFFFLLRFVVSSLELSLLSRDSFLLESKADVSSFGFFFSFLESSSFFLGLSFF